MHAFPSPQGLYDGRHEHDACGVAFVATLTGKPSRDVVDKALTALRNLDHRGASGSEVDSGDGAGMLLQVPDAFLRAVCDVELPAARVVRGRHGVPAVRRGGGRQGPRRGRAARRRGAPAGARLAGGPGRPVVARQPLARLHAEVRPAAGRGRGPAGARGRARPAVLLPAQARRAGGGRLLPDAVVAHAGLQGDAHHRAARHVLPRPAGRADGHRTRGGAQPVLHQHLPELAAGAPVPLHRAQRRDQHGAGQPQLDAGPRGAAQQRPAAG